MTARNLFILAAIITLGFGLPLLFAPYELIRMYAVEPVEPEPVISLLAGGYGTVLVGLGVALIFSLNAKPSVARRGLILVLTVTNILATIVHVSAILRGHENNLAWTIVAVTVIQAVWGGYLLPKENAAIGKRDIELANA